MTSIFLIPGLADSHPDFIAIASLGLILAGLASIFAALRFFGKQTVRVTQNEQPTASDPCSESEAWDRRVSVCASGYSGVIKRRDRLKAATTRGLLQAVGRLEDQDYASVCLGSHAVDGRR